MFIEIRVHSPRFRMLNGKTDWNLLRELTICTELKSKIIIQHNTMAYGDRGVYVAGWTTPMIYDHIITCSH